MDLSEIMKKIEEKYGLDAELSVSTNLEVVIYTCYGSVEYDDFTHLVTDLCSEILH